MAYAASFDQNGSNVFDVPVKDRKSEMPFKGGSYPWNIEGESARLNCSRSDVLIETLWNSGGAGRNRRNQVEQPGLPTIPVPALN